MNPHNRLIALICTAALSLILSSGCRLFQPQVVTLCTNRPEMAAYVEYFNSLSSDVRVVLSYRENPAQIVLNRTRDADLVLGPWLNGSASRKHFDSLAGLFRRDYLDRRDFYGGLLSAGMQEKRQVLLPLSFNLPAVIFLADGLGQDMPNLVVSLEHLREKSGSFNQRVRDRFVRLGFSPLWQPEFFYTASSLFGAQFRETIEGSVTWNSARLQDMRGFSITWIEQINQGFEKDSQFSRKYLYEPMPKLLDEGRVLFYPTDSSSLLRKLSDQAEEADFRWLGSGNRIPVNEEILYIGIPKTARNRPGARLFIAWIFQPETQKRLLAINQEKRLSTFGIAGGLSSLPAVTEREFPQHYRQLLGRIPPEELLGFPKALPVKWSELKNQVVVPWLVEYVTGRAKEELLAQRLGQYRSETTAK